MALKSFKNYDREAAMLRNGGRCPCGNPAVGMQAGYAICQRCRDCERRYYGQEQGRHHRERHTEQLAAGAGALSKYDRVYRVVGAGMTR